MAELTPTENTSLFLTLAILLAAAKICGEIARRFRQPAVLGEIVAGILLGPTLFGRIAPGYHQLFLPTIGKVPVAIEAITTFGAVLFLLTAGIEIDFSKLWHQGRRAALVSTLGVVIPFTLGLGLASLQPHLFGAQPSASHGFVFPLFLGTALSISALPVIARILMDIGLFKSDLGTLVMVSATINDLVGWILFAFILSLMGAGHEVGSFTIGETVLLSLLFVVVILTIGRTLFDRALGLLVAHTEGPGGPMGLVFVVTVAGAAFTSWVGVHAIFGAFIVGVAIGDSVHLREQTRENIHRIVIFVLAPLFFANIGLRVDFVSNFDLRMVLVLITAGTLSKLVGCGFGARLGGLDFRTSTAVGFAMNARGAMEIILGLLALRRGLIDQPLFVSMVIEALATSLAAGPIIHRLVRRRPTFRLRELLSEDLFAPAIHGTTVNAVLAELADRAATKAGLSADRIRELVWRQEQVSSSGLPNQLAMPHARVAGLARPVLVVGRTVEGVDFNAVDGEPALLFFFLLTPEGNDPAHLDLVAEIDGLAANRSLAERLLRAPRYPDLVSILSKA
jgi:Kef-type K+ transport system membrane component KefB/mannitol/fructose-specific phosphotransferase system IIA component (Ntr-type)